jgi:MFS family permease
MCHDAGVGRHSVRATHPGVLIAVLAAAGITVSLTQTLMIPLIPELPVLLNTSPANASWTITVTLLTAAVATPVFGRLGDMHGPKPMLMICAATMTVGSLLAAATSSLVPFLIGRGLQGMSLPIIPLAISVLRSALPPERVGSAMGLISSSLGIGGAMGLPLSAVIAQKADWHTLFWGAGLLGLMALLLFHFLVPDVPASSADKFDPLGTLLLAVGLVALLLPISNGSTWGWTSATTLALLIVSMAVFAVFAGWQFRTPSPIVDLRTTLRRPVLTTNIAAVLVCFSMFALGLVAPQVLELPTGTGYGLGQSMLQAGLWLAPGGLAMMVASPLAARVAGRRGPKFTLVCGSAIIAVAYLGAVWLIGSPAAVMAANIAISLGVGFAYSSLPALINAAVPMSETAAANGINALARSLGTSVSSAVIGTVLATMTITYAGHTIPSLQGLRTALLIAAGVAALAAVIAMTIPGGAEPDADSPVSDWPDESELTGDPLVRG